MFIVLVINRIANKMETTNFGFVASLLFVGVPTIFLIGLFISTQDGEKSSFYSDSSKGRLGPKR